MPKRTFYGRWPWLILGTSGLNWVMLHLGKVKKFWSVQTFISLAISFYGMFMMSLV